MRATLPLVLLSWLALSPAASANQNDEAWSLYADAYEATLEGEPAQAEQLLERLRQRFPGHEATKRAERALSLSRRGTERRAVPPGELGAFLRQEEPVALARAELAILQTFNGIAAGLEVCGLLECADPRPYVVSAMLGGGAGLAASLYLSRDGITQGHTLAVNAGATWGAVHAGLLSLSLSTTTRTTSGMLLAGQLGGTAVGHYLWSALKPGAGDVSLMNSGAIWALVLNLLVQSAAQVNLSSGAYFGAMIAAVDIGLIGGGLLASYMPMSRSRTLVIDAGGILGMLLGFATDMLVGGTRPSDRSFFGLGAVGAVGGLVGATLLTRNWDLDELPPAQLSVLPTEGGATVMAGMSW